MSVDQERGSRREAGGHGLGIAGIELDQDKALPGGAVAFEFRLQLVEEGLLELQDLLHLHAGDAGLGSGAGGVGEDNVFEVVGAGGQDGGAFVDLGRIKQVENRKVLDMKNLVHALDREAAFAVQEIGHVGLFESGLLGEAEAGEFPCLNSVMEDFSEIILQGLELH